MAQMVKREKPLKASLGMLRLLAKSSTQGNRKSATMQSGGFSSTNFWMGGWSMVVALKTLARLSTSVTEDKFSMPSGRPTSWEGK